MTVILIASAFIALVASPAIVAIWPQRERVDGRTPHCRPNEELFRPYIFKPRIGSTHSTTRSSACSLQDRDRSDAASASQLRGD
jgi:hypothetical protein